MIKMPVFECERKVQVLGSSLAMTLPAFFVKANEIQKGNIMKVMYGLKGFLIVCNDDESEDIKETLKMVMEQLDYDFDGVKNNNTRERNNRTRKT
jgi:antitoxin component of MazEF toxin-antitoxin module